MRDQASTADDGSPRSLAEDPIAAAAMRIERLEAAVERLTALNFILSGRVTALEDQSGDATPSAEDVETTIKDAAFLTGFSESGIRQMIAKGKIGARKIGRRVLVNRTSLQTRQSAK